MNCPNSLSVCMYVLYKKYVRILCMYVCMSVCLCEIYVNDHIRTVAENMHVICEPSFSKFCSYKHLVHGT